MVSIYNIINGIEEPTHGYQHRNTSRMLTFGGYVCQGERMIVHRSYCVGWIPFVNHIDTRASSPGYEGYCILHGI
jgi:hypothetical protein